MHNKNGLAKLRWKIIITIKNSMLIDIGLSNNFWAEAMETTNYFYNRLPTKSKNHSEITLKKV